jgi:hypothetical protein
MANGKPDTSDGWYKLAHEMGAALDLANFTKSEMLVLSITKAQWFGAGMRLVLIKPSEISDKIGCKRQFVQKGLDGLVKARVLIHKEGDFYEFNKGYNSGPTSWIHNDGTAFPNGTRFTQGEIAFIEGAVDRAVTYRRVSGGKKPHKHGNNELRSATIQLQNATNELQGGATIQLQNCNPIVAESKPDSCTFGEDTNRNARVLEKEEEKNNTRERVAETFQSEENTPPLKVAPETQPEPKLKSSIECPPEFLALCRKAKGIPDLEAVRFARTLHEAFGVNGDLTNQWLYGMVPYGAWEAAIVTLAGKPIEKRTLPFYLAIAKDPNQKERYRQAEKLARQNNAPVEPTKYFKVGPRNIGGVA